MASVDTFIPGYRGTPGDRTFYFEVRSKVGRTWYLVEKQQMAAFSVEAAKLLAERGLTGAGEDLDVPEVGEPDDVAFRVASIRLRLEPESGAVTVQLEAADGATPAVTLLLTVAQLDAASRAGAAAVRQGRPRCPDCGLAVDLSGHHCPLTNGDLRNHRP